jgi:hypothetical protein
VGLQTRAAVGALEVNVLSRSQPNTGRLRLCARNMPLALQQAGLATRADAAHMCCTAG